MGTTSAAQLVTLSNTGEPPLKLIGAQTGGDFVAGNTCGNSLIGHSACSISITYAPAHIGPVTGTLTVTDMLHTQTVALSGIGLAPPGISATPRLVDFGSQGLNSTSPVQIVTITNNGGVDLVAPAPTLNGDYMASSTTCQPVLPVGSACQLMISFLPTQTGLRSGTLTMSSPTLASPLLVSLAGIGEDFQLMAAGAGSLTITSGQTATYTLQVSPVAGSNGALTLTCSGAPVNSTCTLNPASLQMVSGTTQSLTMTVATGISTATSSLVPTSIPVGFRGWLLAACVPLGLTGLRRRPSRKIFLALGALGFLLRLRYQRQRRILPNNTHPSSLPGQRHPLRHLYPCRDRVGARASAHRQTHARG